MRVHLQTAAVQTELTRCNNAQHRVMSMRTDTNSEGSVLKMQDQKIEELVHARGKKRRVQCKHVTL